MKASKLKITKNKKPINNFERNEENKIAEGTETTESKINMSDQIPNNVSIENTTYMENNSGIDFEKSNIRRREI